MGGVDPQHKCYAAHPGPIMQDGLELVMQFDLSLNAILIEGKFLLN